METGMSKVPQSKDELESHLKEQLAFLKASAQAYDGGFKGEAKRLAVVVRILVHDTAASKSLLGQLGLKAIPFCDTSYDYDPRKYFLSFHGLAMMMVNSSGGEYVPRYAVPPKPRGEPLKFVTFDQWWSKVVVVDASKTEFTRRRLVLVMADQEGGAHVDPKLDAAYAALARHNTMALSYRFNEREGDFSGIQLASVRQIAHEILRSIEDSCPQLFQ
jgi:hypothetical protein